MGNSSPKSRHQVLVKSKFCSRILQNFPVLGIGDIRHILGIEDKKYFSDFEKCGISQKIAIIYKISGNVKKRLQWLKNYAVKNWISLDTVQTPPPGGECFFITKNIGASVIRKNPKKKIFTIFENLKKKIKIFLQYFDLDYWRKTNCKFW